VIQPERDFPLAGSLSKTDSSLFHHFSSHRSAFSEVNCTSLEAPTHCAPAYFLSGLPHRPGSPPQECRRLPPLGESSTGFKSPSGKLPGEGQTPPQGGTLPRHDVDRIASPPEDFSQYFSQDVSELPFHSDHHLPSFPSLERPFRRAISRGRLFLTSPSEAVFFNTTPDEVLAHHVVGRPPGQAFSLPLTPQVDPSH